MERLKAKYGGLVPKRKLLGTQGAHHKAYFDSGDYFRGGGKPSAAAAAQPPPPQLEPSQPAGARRSSQLGDGTHAAQQQQP